MQVIFHLQIPGNKKDVILKQIWLTSLIYKNVNWDPWTQFGAQL